MSWTTVVTTAPRKECTLIQTLDSLEECGWTPVVFAEPGSTPTSRLTFWNESRLGVWHNWLKAARWGTEQGTDFVMTVQDDTEFHLESKDLIESIKWPEDAGYVSLYTPKHYQFWADRTTPRRNGIYAIKTQSMWGAVALVFRTEILRQLVEHPRSVSWLGVRSRKKSKWPELKQRRIENSWMIQNSDTIIGSILIKNLKRRLYYFNPSPATHISRFSAIGHGDNKGRRNAYFVAAYDLPLVDQIFQRQKHDAV